MRLIVLAAVLALLGSAAHAQTQTLVDMATISMSAPGVPRTVTNTVCVTDGNDLVCDRGATLTQGGTFISIGSITSQYSFSVSRTNSGDWAEFDFRSGRTTADEKIWNIANNASTGFLQFRTLNDARSQTLNYPLTLTRDGRMGVSATTPQTSLQVGGSIRLAVEVSGTLGTCDANRTGAIRFTGGDFSFCRNGSAWEALASLGGGALKLASLTDVVTSGAVSGSVLAYNAATSSWTALPIQQVMSTTTMLAGWPDAIQCTMGGGVSAIFYLAFSPFTDGRYYYRASEGVASSGSSIYTQIAFSSTGSYYGFYSTNAANSSAGDCAGKAISQLYTEGKAFNLIGSANASGGTALGDRITSGTASGVVAMAGGTISFTTGGTSGTAYLDTVGRFVGVGVSTTGAVSAASVYAGASLQLASPTAVTACNSGSAGTIRYNSPTTTLELCTGSGWQPMGVGIPAGTISAFASTTCPTGWSEYTAARGRFLRGIDNGAGNDPDGTRAPGAAQADDLKSHTHPIYRRAWYANELIGGGTFFTPTGTSDNANVLMNTNATGGAETRPKNVAVTYCQFNGTSNGWNNPLSGGSTVAAGSTGQVQYNTAGSFDASPDFSWTNGSKVLGVGGTVSASKVATNEVFLSKSGGLCSTLADEGRMFRNPTSGRLQVCAVRY